MPGPADPPAADKDARTRLEKFAQSHLDRAQTISTGATKTALAWVVALAIIWFQQLEQHRDTHLANVRKAQASLVNLHTATDSLGESGSAFLMARTQKDQSLLQEADKTAGNQQIDLPFSIKINLPPEWVPSLWLATAFGLSVYMLNSRKRVLRLASKGVVLQREAGVEDPR
ncbi:MAG TPA: hypothetical protein VNH18_08695, partial [Bryobacteraceae bacterium]|nr:hypothetical protein [Bryobacteraceae bacterium]